MYNLAGRPLPARAGPSSMEHGRRGFLFRVGRRATMDPRAPLHAVVPERDIATVDLAAA